MLKGVDAVLASALIAGGFTSVASLGSQWLATRRERDRDDAQTKRTEDQRQWEAHEERVTELRAVLDEAGVALAMATNDGDLVWLALKRTDYVDTSDLMASLERRIESIGELGARLAVRLGPDHPATSALRDAANATIAARSALRRATEGDQTALREAADKLEVARKARRDYFVATERLIGPLHEPENNS
jgi:hypothetical protein